MADFSPLAELVAQSNIEDRLDKWHLIPEIQEAYRQLADDFISKLEEPKTFGEGRGIVIPGGGVKYFPSMWVGINRLRQVGNTLPVEVWHFENEFDPGMARLLTGIGDVVLRKVADEDRARLSGWELKSHAIRNSAFKEILFLDADCAPVCDPTYLFNIPEYTETGAILWPDFPRYILKDDQYDAFGCEHAPPFSDYGEHFEWFGTPIHIADPPVESGEIVVDKSRCWRELALCGHFCDHSKYYYRFVHGDKECLHFGWRRLKSLYGMPRYWPGWSRNTYLQFGFRDEVLFTHRTQEKWALGVNKSGKGVPGEEFSHKLISDLKYLWSGKIWVNKNPNETEREMMKDVENKMYLYHRVGLNDARPLEILPNSMIGTGRKSQELSWSLFEVENKPVLSFLGHSGVTCLLNKNGGGWKGKWEINEKCDVELLPSLSAAVSKTGKFIPNKLPLRLEYSPAGTKLYEIPNEKLKGSFNFNPGLILDKDGTFIMAYRHGDTQAMPSQISLCRLTEKFEFKEHLSTSHPIDAFTIEDPRIFRHNDKLYFSASTGNDFGSMRVGLYELDDEYMIKNNWTFKSPDNRECEKNWTFFSLNGELYFVYEHNPYRVFQIDLKTGEYVGNWSNPVNEWAFGNERGSTPPVRVGDEFVSLFHSVYNTRTDSGEWRFYRIVAGAYKFAARPTFPVTWKSRIPLMVPTNDGVPQVWYTPIVYPSGLVRKNEHYIISYGYQDSCCRIAVIPEKGIFES